jgi:NAD(P)-dependent dehydrogenase (short-subunit alcohol dehydrogenase family)
MTQRWTADDIPDQAGKIVVITGANSGLGFEATWALLRKGAHVVMACRDIDRGRQAAAQLAGDAADGGPAAAGRADVLQLDLADLASVRAFAETFGRQYPRLDILLNNAGVMAIPYRTTAQGFEMQFGTNHLGHFALTGLLLPAILAAPKARVVTVSSLRHRPGHIDFTDLQLHNHYTPYKAYDQAKLANLLFAYELQRRFTAHGARAISLAAHPGYSATNLQGVGPRMSGSALQAWAMRLANRFVAQSAAMGALPELFAATAPGVQGGEYYGPDGYGEIRGYPRLAASNAESHDPEVARRLWDMSEILTDVKYEPIFAAATASPA